MAWGGRKSPAEAMPPNKILDLTKARKLFMIPSRQNWNDDRKSYTHTRPDIRELFKRKGRRSQSGSKLKAALWDEGLHVQFESLTDDNERAARRVAGKISSSTRSLRASASGQGRN